MTSLIIWKFMALSVSGRFSPTQRVLSLTSTTVTLSDISEVSFPPAASGGARGEMKRGASAALAGGAARGLSLLRSLPRPPFA